MRWVGWVLVTVLGGCTGLNGAFDDRADPATTGVATAATSSAMTNPTGAPPPTVSGSGVTSVGETTADPPDPTTVGKTGSTSTTGTTGERTSSGSTAGKTGVLDAATGSGTEVIFIYAADDWMAPGNYPPTSSASDHCVEHAPAAASLCDSEAVALLRQPDLTLATILTTLPPQWLGASVFGIGSGGETPLANSPADLLEGLETSLSDGGVDDPSKTGLFFSGGPADITDTCEGWSDPFSTAIAGSFDDASDSWFSAGGIVDCPEHLPILCACLSGPDPFS